MNICNCILCYRFSKHLPKCSPRHAAVSLNSVVNGDALEVEGKAVRKKQTSSWTNVHSYWYTRFEPDSPSTTTQSLSRFRKKLYGLWLLSIPLGHNHIHYPSYFAVSNHLIQNKTAAINTVVLCACLYLEEWRSPSTVANSEKYTKRTHFSCRLW
jgi:hypothetical protein